MSNPRDDNQRLQDGDLPEDPEADAEPIGADGKPIAIAKHWLTLADAKVDLEAAPPNRRWLLKHGKDGVLPRGKVGVLAANGGAGKTMALVQLAYAVATGTDWLGTFQVPEEETGNVLLMLGEEDLEEVQRRFYNVAIRQILVSDAFQQANDDGKRALMEAGAKDRELARQRIVALPLAGVPVALTAKDAKGNTVETTALEHLRTRLNDRKWSIIILDPLARFAGDDTEIDNAAATRFVQAVESLVRSPGTPTVLVAHHSGKTLDADGNPKVRGSSAITDGFRWAATLAPLDDGETHGAVLHCFKSNYAMPFSDVYLVKPKDSGGVLVRATDEQREAIAQAQKDDDAEARRVRAEALKQNAETKAKAEARRQEKGNPAKQVKHDPQGRY